MRTRPLLAAVAIIAAPVFAQTAPDPQLRQKVEAVLATAPAGTRFGLLVLDDKGHEVLAINPDQRFIPASNTKLFTTALALDVFSRNADAAFMGGTRLALFDRGKGPPDLALSGGGGVSLSTAPSCEKRCLASLVAKVAATTRKVGNLIADDTTFPDQRWSPGMSWNNIQSASGTATSALMVDDNERLLMVTPGKVGSAPVVALTPYFTVRNEAVTVADGPTNLALDRAINSREVRIYGTIPVSAKPWHETLGIDDPADYAGWALQQALQARGVTVGRIIVVHRPMQVPGSTGPVVMPTGKLRLAYIEPALPLADEVININKLSLNLHAESLLRRAGDAAAAGNVFSPRTAASGSREGGLQALQAMLDRAGVARSGYDFSDGSGMSSYNRVSPRAAVTLLRWGAEQGWAATWRASLPVAGVDGTLARRFLGTPLQGRLRAKTGTLNATNALSGYLTAASGRELIFSAFANDVPGDQSAAGVIDLALGVVAAAN